MSLAQDTQVAITTLHGIYERQQKLFVMSTEISRDTVMCSDNFPAGTVCERKAKAAMCSTSRISAASSIAILMIMRHLSSGGGIVFTSPKNEQDGDV